MNDELGEPELMDLSSQFNNDIQSLKSVNHGGGLDLLMNNTVGQKKRIFHSSNDLDDITHLENELNEFHLNDLSSGEFEGKESPRNVHFSEKDDIDINIGKFTAETPSNNSKTWDGYGKFNDIPINPDMSIPNPTNLSKEETLREKFKYLKKLEALEKKGVELSQKYTMESSLAEMQGEYETINDETGKQQAVKMYGTMLTTVIQGLEFLNTKFDPCDLKLNGWGDQVSENIQEYDDIFEELHNKYKSKVKMMPEIRLMLQLGGSAMMLHLTNSMFKSAMPGMDDIFRQNPELMRQFQSAAVNSMSQQNPNFANFMGDTALKQPSQNQQKGPPPPIATSLPHKNVKPPQDFPKTYQSNNKSSEINIQMTRPNFADPPRPDMKGPSDISHILSGLKTKTIQLKTQEPSSSFNPPPFSVKPSFETSSVTSEQGKKSKRKVKSDKNTISLDL
jgi:hypothetical protein